MRQAQAGELRQEPRGTEEHGVAKDGTWRALAQDYMESPEFRALDPGTQSARRRMLEHTFKEPIRPGAKEVFADFPLIHFTRKVVKILHNLKADTPDAANARLQAIRAVFKWALDNEDRRVTVNPARDVEAPDAKAPERDSDLVGGRDREVPCAPPSRHEGAGGVRPDALHWCAPL